MTNEVRHSGQPYRDGAGGAALALARGARGRLLKNNLLAQGVNAFTVALAAFILLLLLGAEILDWRWLVPIPLATAAAGIFRAWRRVPSLYRTAQIVDRRMGLSDALSTAIFFRNEPEPGGASRDILRSQAERADSLARSVDVRRAIPYTFPRAAYASGALFLLASSLLALRYGVTRRLDLKPPLAAILKLDLGLNERLQAKANPDPPAKPDPKNEEEQTASGDRATRRDPGKGAQNRNPSQAGEQSKRGRESGQEQPIANDAGEQRDRQQESASDEQQRASGRQAGEQQSAKDSAGEKQAAAERGKQNGEGQSSSLMDKFRDAVQNLMSRMKPSQQQRGGGQQQAEGDRGKNDSQQSGANQQQARNGGQNGKTQGQSRPGQGEADRSADESPAASKGQGGSADSAANANKPSSGAGNEDGKKDIKQAEQLEAMGKISEILGKRSANLSGEATVEVQSTDQQLRTPYAERAAGRSSTGGEIGRDEVPLALQSYIEHYFEQVRKEKKK